MHRIERSMYTETSHFLRDHPGLCKHWHGHSYKWTVELETDKLVNDMVMDFTHLKDIMESVIGKYDHAIVVDKQAINDLAYNNGIHTSENRVVVFSHRPTAERMAAAVYAEIRELIPAQVRLVKVVCRETRNNKASYGE